MPASDEHSHVRAPARATTWTTDDRQCQAPLLQHSEHARANASNAHRSTEEARRDSAAARRRGAWRDRSPTPRTPKTRAPLNVEPTHTRNDSNGTPTYRQEAPPQRAASTASSRARVPTSPADAVAPRSHRGTLGDPTGVATASDARAPYRRMRQPFVSGTDVEIMDNRDDRARSCAQSDPPGAEPATSLTATLDRRLHTSDTTESDARANSCATSNELITRATVSAGATNVWRESALAHECDPKSPPTQAPPRCCATSLTATRSTIQQERRDACSSSSRYEPKKLAFC